MKLEDIDLSSLKKALQSLQKAIEQPKNEFMRDSVIQRFEYTFELSWKVLRKYFLANNNTQIDNVKNIFREAAKQNLIQNLEFWFNFLNARNETSHSYEESVAERVYQQAIFFEKEAVFLLKCLEKVLD